MADNQTRNGPQPVCAGCWRTHNRFTLFCTKCERQGAYGDAQLTAADQAYLAWKRTKDAGNAE